MIDKLWFGKRTADEWNSIKADEFDDIVNKINEIVDFINGADEVLCPKCFKGLGKPTEVDLNTIGWHCSDCGIKIYKEVKKDG